jgi:hypothetical protein
MKQTTLCSLLLLFTLLGACKKEETNNFYNDHELSFTLKTSVKPLVIYKKSEFGKDSFSTKEATLDYKFKSATGNDKMYFIFYKPFDSPEGYVKIDWKLKNETYKKDSFWLSDSLSIGVIFLTVPN